MPALIIQPSHEHAQVSAIVQQKLESLIQCRTDILQSSDHATKFLQPPTIADCAAHLKLLNAFVYLKLRVLSWNDQSGTPPDDGWQQYLRLAVIRFNIWMCALDVTAPSSLLPPLDVLLVWHAFMLNPAEYWKYNAASKGNKKSMRWSGIPWVLVKSAIDADTGVFNLSHSQETAIEDYNLHPDLLKILAEEEITKGPKSMFRLPFSNSGGTACTVEDSFSGNHESPKDTKEHLLLKLYTDMATSGFTTKTTGFDPIAAVNRQMKFAEKMAQFDWLHSPAISSTLETALERYTRFFQILTSSPGMVPTLDVDLVWHTHQLSPSRYLFFCKEHHGGLIDHDDKVEGSTIENGFDRTQQAYQARFSENYLLCHSWYCEVGRLLLKDGILLEDYSGLDSMIEAQNQRRKKLGARILLDLAPCQCKSLSGPGITGQENCTSNCGSICSGNCHQGCSSNCCGNCSSSCAAF